jgi:glycosyltransferase involved in cell wall biosynthesis
MWSRFGPYHTARLDALSTFLDRRGVELVAIETASLDRNAWRVETGEDAYRRVTVFPGREFESVPGPEVERKVRAVLDRLSPDAVAVPSYSTPDARAALAWCRRHRRVAVMLFDSRREDAARSGWREAVKRAIVREFDAALVAGTPQRDYAVELGVPPSHVFQPLDVVDNAHFRSGGAEAGRRLLGLDGHRPFFLAVNRFVPRKGLHILLDAYDQYRARAASPWDLVLVGDGAERGRLSRAAGPGVTFPGFLPYPALPSVYAAAAAFVHPATADQWGLVVNEAMAAGLPVLVSTGAGCAQDLVADGENGFLFPPEDPAALADRLGTLAALPDARRQAMGDRSRDIIGRFQPADFADGLWRAVQAGHQRADRPLSPTASVILGVLRIAARAPASFQSIPD